MALSEEYLHGFRQQLVQKRDLLLVEFQRAVGAVAAIDAVIEELNRQPEDKEPEKDG